MNQLITRKGIGREKAAPMLLALSAMDSEIKIYSDILDELLLLLENYNEEHWYNYFSESKSMLDAGKAKKSAVYSLKAYGGMCSFSDELYFTGASEKEAARGFELRGLLWNQSQKVRNKLKRFWEI